MPIRPRDPNHPLNTPASTRHIVARTRVRVPVPLSEPGGAATPDPVELSPPKRPHHVVDRTTDNWDTHGNYIVGKGRPPVSTRWRKGQSGNPRGPKPREVLDPQAAFQRELMANFTARVNSQDVTLNLGTFALNLLKGAAAKGSVKAQQLLLDMFTDAVRRSAGRDDAPEVEAWEQEVIEQMLAAYDLPAKPVVRKERERPDLTGGDA